MTPRPAAARRWLLAAAGLGLLLRLAFGLGYWTDKPLTRDEREYLSLARSLADGRGFVHDAAFLAAEPDPFGRAPGYPLFLAVAGGGGDPTPSVPATVKVVQALVGALGVALMGALGWAVGGPRAGRAAAILAAVYPPLVWISAYALSEVLFWPLSLLTVWVFDRAAAARGRAAAGAALVAGVLAGLTALVRSVTVPFLGLAALWLLWRRRPGLAAALVAGAAIAMAPWAARNLDHYGRFVLVTTDGGVTFWTGNNPLAGGEGDMAANPDIKRASLALRAAHPHLSQEQMEPIYYREALAWIRENPVDWIGLEARKLFYTFVPVGPSYTLHSPLYYLASVVSYGLLVPAAAVGAWRLGRRRRRTPGLWLLGLSAVVVCLVFFPQERFRIPVIDPVLILCAAGLRSGPPDEDA